MTIKMYCVFAMESVKKMNGNRGKLASMAGHAYLHSFWDSMTTVGVVPPEVRHILNIKQKQAIDYAASEKAFKITLIVDTVDQLKELQESYKDVCGTSLVTDAGLTVFDGPTTVCLGIGPIAEVNIKDDLKNLKVFM